MKNTKSMKRLVRRLQELRGCSYGVALNELRSLPEGTSLRAYVDKVAATRGLIPEDQKDPPP